MVAILNKMKIAPMIALICLKEASKILIVFAYYSRSANWKRERVK